MNGQDPNQNLNNINPTPAPAPENPAPATSVAPAPVASVPEAPVVADPSAVMPTPVDQSAQAAAVPTPISAEGIMPQPAAPAPAPAPVAPAAPVVADPSAVMPSANQAPVADIMPEAPAVQAAPAQSVTPAPAAPLDPNTQVVPNAAPVTNPAAPDATANPNGAAPENGNKAPKAAIAIDKNIIIIVVGLIIIAGVLFFAWKNGILFKKKPTPTNNVVNPAPNPNPEPAKPTGPQNTKEAQAKMNKMDWFKEYLQEKYSQVSDDEDITKETDTMLYFARKFYAAGNKKVESEFIDPVGTCKLDAEALTVLDVNKLLLTVFDEELANKDLNANNDTLIYSKEEYTKLKSSSTCSSAKACSLTKDCKISESYVLYEDDTDIEENEVDFDELSYDTENNVLSGNIEVTLAKGGTKEATFEITFDDDDLITSIVITK